MCFVVIIDPLMVGKLLGNSDTTSRQPLDLVQQLITVIPKSYRQALSTGSTSAAWRRGGAVPSGAATNIQCLHHHFPIELCYKALAARPYQGK